jgi:hypothetical protein
MNTQLLLFDDSQPGRPEPAPPLPGFADLAPTLTDELASVWGLPLGRKVRVELRNHSVAGLSGMLEVARLPDFPFDAKAPLSVRIGHVAFTSRELAAWSMED